MSAALLPDGCIEWVLRSSTVMGLAWLMSFIPRIPAALRHTWIAAAMLAALGMPLFISVLPSWSPGPLTRFVRDYSAPQTGSAIELPGAELVSLPWATSASSVDAAAPFVPDSVAVLPPAEKPLSLLWVWFIGTTLLAMRLLTAALTWHRVVRSAESLRGPWRMDIRLTSRVSAPVSGGLWRCIVLLPADSIHWTHGRMNAVLVHEEEHLRRRDGWWLLFGHLLCAVQWFNPLAWLIHRRAAILREEACDAVALLRGVPPAEYADALLALASPCGLSALASPMVRRTGLERRIRSVLNPSQLLQSVSRSATLFSLAGLCGFTLCSSILRSQEKSVPSSPMAGAAEDLRQSPAQQLSAALKCSDRVTRMKRFLAALELKTAENADECNEVWGAWLAEGRADGALASFYNIRDGEVKGARVLEARSGSPVDFTAIGTINENLVGAMKTDPEGVKVWLNSLKNEKFLERMRGVYISTLASQNLPAAMEMMTMGNLTLQQQTAGAIVSALRGSRGATEMAEWVRVTLKAPTNAEAPWLSTLFQEAVNQASITRQGAYIGAALLEEFAGQPFAVGADMNRVSSKFALSKPIDALNWAARMEQKLPPPSPGTLLASAISVVSDQSLRAVADWCRSRSPGPDREAAMAALINRAATVDPALAAELKQPLSAAIR